VRPHEKQVLDLPTTDPTTREEGLFLYQGVKVGWVIRKVSGIRKESDKDDGEEAVGIEAGQNRLLTTKNRGSRGRIFRPRGHKKRET